MTETAIINILKQKGIYITHTRVIVFKTLLSHIGAANAAEIHRLAPLKLDRVSVYRTLQVFLKKGLISLAPNSNGWPQYLIKDLAPPGTSIEPNKIATYFICRNCGAIKPIKIFNLVSDLVPQGYQVDSCQVILKGKCEHCNVYRGEQDASLA